MFGRKLRKQLQNMTILRWNDAGAQQFQKKITVKIVEIKPFVQKYWGVKNSPSSLTFVSEAMEVHGKTEDSSVEKKDIFLLIPDFEITAFHIHDTADLWISQEGFCFKVEKTSP